jgi:hypothetical protein
VDPFAGIAIIEWIVLELLIANGSVYQHEIGECVHAEYLGSVLRVIPVIFSEEAKSTVRA